MFNPRKGQWWNAPPEQKFEAYYMTLRVHYEMSALEAYNTAKAMFAAYPDMMANLLGSIQRAIKH